MTTPRNRRILLGISLVGLLAAYIPNGFPCVILGFLLPWQELFPPQGSGLFGPPPPTGILLVLYDILQVWLLWATFLGNAQLVACLATLGKPDSFFQRRWVKIFALVAQLSWGYMAYPLYVWYLWVVFTAMLYWIAESPDLAWSKLFRREKVAGG